MSLSENIYRKTDTGLKEFSDFHTYGLQCLEKYELSQSAQENAIRRLAMEITVGGEPNTNSSYLVAMPDGNVADFEALAEVMADSENEIDSRKDQWMKPVSQYQDRYITLRTGARYNGKVWEGAAALKGFLRLVLDPMDIPAGIGISPLEELISWIILFTGRLLIGGNIRKECAIFLGEKDSGKTTFVNLLMDIMGGYAGSITGDILYSRGSYRDATLRALYRMKSLRFLLHSEGSNSEKINTANFKMITGGTKLPLSDGPSFILDGTLVEDTNYAPNPNNLHDEAFENRIVIIPFKRNSQNVPAINEAIRHLYEQKDAVFSLMVWAAAKNILEKTGPGQAAISRRAYFLLSSFREPVKAFFACKCEPHATKDQWVRAEELFSIYGEWFGRFMSGYAARFPFLRSEMGLAEDKLKQMAPTAFNKEFWSIHPHMKRLNKGLVFFFLSIKNGYLPQTPEKAAMVDHINRLDNAIEQYEAIEKDQKETERLRQGLTKKQTISSRQIRWNPDTTFGRSGAPMMPPPSMYQFYPDGFRGPEGWYQPGPPSPPPSHAISWSLKAKKEKPTITIVGKCQSNDIRECAQELQAIKNSDGPYRPCSQAAMAYYDEYGEYPATHQMDPLGHVTRDGHWEAYVDAYLRRIPTK
jgi:hypothetical protein